MNRRFASCTTGAGRSLKRSWQAYSARRCARGWVMNRLRNERLAREVLAVYPTSRAGRRAGMASPRPHGMIYTSQGEISHRPPAEELLMGGRGGDWVSYAVAFLVSYVV